MLRCSAVNLPLALTFDVVLIVVEPSLLTAQLLLLTATAAAPSDTTPSATRRGTGTVIATGTTAAPTTQRFAGARGRASVGLTC